MAHSRLILGGAKRSAPLKDVGAAEELPGVPEWPPEVRLETLPDVCPAEFEEFVAVPVVSAPVFPVSVPVSAPAGVAVPRVLVVPVPMAQVSESKTVEVVKKDEESRLDRVAAPVVVEPVNVLDFIVEVLSPVDESVDVVSVVAFALVVEPVEVWVVPVAVVVVVVVAEDTVLLGVEVDVEVFPLQKSNHFANCGTIILEYDPGSLAPQWSMQVSQCPNAFKKSDPALHTPSDRPSLCPSRAAPLQSL